jgi:ion channel
MDGSSDEPGSATRRLRERYGLLLGAIIVTFAIQGIATPSAAEQILVSVFLGATLLLALWATDTRPRIMRPSMVLVALVTIVSVVQAVNGHIDGAATRIANALLVALAPPAIVVGVVRDLRARHTVTIQAVMGVLCVYLLIGMFFAFVYGALGRLAGAPFFAGSQQSTVASCLYFSFTTLSTVGYGDLTARSNLGHTLSVSEALLGQVYLVTVVSLVVANLGRGGRQRP